MEQRFLRPSFSILLRMSLTLLFSCLGPLVTEKPILRREMFPEEWNILPQDLKRKE